MDDLRLYKQRMGSLLVILSAFGFSTLGVFGRHAFEAGYTRNQALFWRFALALPFMALIAYFFGARPRSARSFMRSVLLGFIGIGVEASLYFLTMEHLGAALTGIFLYLYPAFVALISHFFLRERLSGKLWFCVALSLAGCVLTAGVMDKSSVSPMKDPVGIFFGIATACWYAVYILTGARVMKDEHPLIVSFGIVLGAFGAFLALSFYEVENGTPLLVPHDFPSLYPVLGLALIASVLPFTTLYSGMLRVGALSAAVLSTLEMVFTIVLAWAFLGERLSFQQGDGAVLILLSVLLTTFLRRQ